ncbi:hypothetical protein ACFQVB_24725 [Paraburkholderia humisilvae]|uniref:hypothetical protein n=1 Tax=Paraburkholderia humisilvae TaxID=627669 RepID=UPI00360FFABC
MEGRAACATTHDGNVGGKRRFEYSKKPGDTKEKPTQTALAIALESSQQKAGRIRSESNFRLILSRYDARH